MVTAAYPIILGMSWIRRHDPNIHWRAGIMGLTCLFRDCCNRRQEAARTGPVSRFVNAVVNTVPSLDSDSHNLESSDTSSETSSHYPCSVYSLGSPSEAPLPQEDESDSSHWRWDVPAPSYVYDSQEDNNYEWTEEEDWNMEDDEDIVGGIRDFEVYGQDPGYYVRNYPLLSPLSTHNNTTPIFIDDEINDDEFYPLGDNYLNVHSVFRFA
ncbi:hypothetical protein ABG067_007791, partial [Albugo candida]